MRQQVETEPCTAQSQMPRPRSTLSGVQLRRTSDLWMAPKTHVISPEEHPDAPTEADGICRQPQIFSSATFPRSCAKKCVAARVSAAFSKIHILGSWSGDKPDSKTTHSGRLGRGMGLELWEFPF